MTRIDSSSKTFPQAVTVIPVDYDSLDSLTKALNGQDALVSTLSAAALSAQLLLVKAAAKAKVKRYIPSEFGSNTLNEKVRALPAFKPKVSVQDALKKEAASSDGISYTLIYNGPFLDWGIKVGFLINIKEQSVTLYDGGERLVSATSLATIGKAVVGVLRNPTQTQNRAVYVQDTVISQQKLKTMGQKAIGEGSKEWKDEVVSVDSLLKESYDALKTNPDTPRGAMVNFIKISIFGDGYGCHFQELDNELLGIEQMKDFEIQKMLDGFVKPAMGS